jgi:CHAT domain-containing protein
VANLTDPLRSRVVLGDGELTLEEILRLRLRVRLAVLAACETAMVGTVLPDEVVSLPTGLVQAGAAAVIASMWGCDQLATAVILVEFYRRLPEVSPATALRDAQRCVRDSTRDELQQRWETALDEACAWLPESAGEPLLNLLLLDPPSDREPRPWSGVETWAALSFTGA